MTKKDPYHYRCPKCGTSMGVYVTPIGGPPSCNNYEHHHNKRTYAMEYVAEKSAQPEPDPYPKSNKKVFT